MWANVTNTTKRLAGEGHLVFYNQVIETVEE